MRHFLYTIADLLWTLFVAGVSGFIFCVPEWVALKLRYSWPTWSQRGRQLELWFDTEILPAIEADTEERGLSLSELSLARLRRRAIRRWVQSGI